MPDTVFVEPDVFANIVSDDDLMKILPRSSPAWSEPPPCRA